MDKDELLERYEALGQDEDFLAAKPLFEAEIQRREQSEAGLHGPDAALLLRQYGYLLQCHGRIAIRRAIEQYERAIALDPGADKVRYQWIGAKAALFEPEDAITLYRQRVAASPRDVRELRFLAHAYLAAKDFDAAKGVIDTGLAPRGRPITSYDPAWDKGPRLAASPQNRDPLAPGPALQPMAGKVAGDSRSIKPSAGTGSWPAQPGRSAAWPRPSWHGSRSA